MKDPAPRILHLEPTTECNLHCRSCGRFYLANRWQKRYLTLDMLQSLGAVAPPFETVHLGGWGEPLLHPDITNIVRFFSDRGSQVHIRTNGQLLDAPLVEGLAAAGTASIRFRLAGATAATHDAICGKGTFDAALNAVRVAAIHRKSDKTPLIVIDYLLTSEAFDELPQLMAICARIGVDRVAPGHLYHPVARSQVHLAAYNKKRVQGITRIKTRMNLMFSGIDLAMPEMEERQVPVCGENPIVSVFVAGDGTVAPCPFLNPPIEGEYPLLYKDKRRMVRRLPMGDLKRHSMNAIWQSAYYRQFRAMFETRVEAFEQMTGSMGLDRHAVDQHYEETLVKARDLLQKQYPAPRPCRVCIRVDGL